jgi:transposase
VVILIFLVTLLIGAYVVAEKDFDNQIAETAINLETNATLSHLAFMYGIKHPFYISETKLDKERFEFNIFITYDRKLTFTSPCCNEPNCKIHSKAPRKWRALDTSNYKVFLHLNVPKLICPKCGKIVSHQVDWARKGCGLTELFEQKTIALAENMQFTAVSKVMGESANRLSLITHRAVREGRQNLDWKDVKIIGVDETSKAKGHDYISVIVDMYESKVLYATEGKDWSILRQFANELVHNNGVPAQIKEVAIDMSPAFISGVSSIFPDANITFDKFHVIKLVNEAVDKVRREESKENPILKGTRYIWLHNPENLSAKQQKELTQLSKQNLKTARAYRYKRALQSIYKDIDNPDDAIIQLNKLISWGNRSRLEPLKQVAKTLKNHLCGILRYFTSHLTSGIVEGINSKIQEIKRRAKGFRNVEHFINMIYLGLGNLPILRLYGTGQPVTDINQLQDLNTELS